MKLRVVFLDLDGVLTTRRSRTRRARRQGESVVDYYASLMDPLMVSWVNQILRQSRAVIVLSSDWRDERVVGFDLTKDALIRAGICAPVVDRTPLPAGQHRGYTIAQYVKNNGLRIEEFIILDDDPKAGVPYNSRWIRGDINHGLPVDSVQQAQRLFGLRPT